MEEIINNFIVFEGIDGCGKSTQMRLLEKRLKKDGMATELTREPTDEGTGRLIRKILSGEEMATRKALALLYAADRDNHLYGPNGVLKKINEGKLVLSDRYFYSSLAYQAVDATYEFVSMINDFPHPEFLIYLDLDVASALKRINERSEKTDIFEKQDFLEKVSANFEKALSLIPKEVKLLKVSTSGTEAETAERIYSFISQHLL